MPGLLQKSGHLLRYYREFGWEGLRFLYRQKLGREELLRIQPQRCAHPLYLRKGTTDLPMFDCIFRGHEMDVDLPRQPSVIVDCGAHIGLSAVLFANRYPQARIYALEPEPSNFELLLRNTNPYPNIHCLNKGLWNKTTHLRIIDAGFGHWGFMTEEAREAAADTIEAISIPDLIKEFGLGHIDLCKINIEGTEKEVFEENSEPWLSRTSIIIIELHDRMRKGCSPAFFQALSRFDYAIDPKGSYLVCHLHGSAPNP